MALSHNFDLEDTAGGKLDIPTLTAAIQSSGLITVSLKDIIPGIDDFDVEFLVDLPVGEETELSALVSQHTGEPEDTVVLVEPTHVAGDPTLHLYVQGLGFAVDPLDSNGITEFDYHLTEERWIEGAMAHVFGGCPGDKLDFEFWAPTGLAEPNHELMVGLIGEDIEIPPGGIVPEIRSSKAKRLAAGLFLRLRYICDEDHLEERSIRVGINIRWHRKGAV